MKKVGILKGISEIPLKMESFAELVGDREIILFLGLHCDIYYTVRRSRLPKEPLLEMFARPFPYYQYY